MATVPGLLGTKQRLNNSICRHSSRLSTPWPKLCGSWQCMQYLLVKVSTSVILAYFLLSNRLENWSSNRGCHLAYKNCTKKTIYGKKLCSCRDVWPLHWMCDQHRVDQAEDPAASCLAPPHPCPWRENYTHGRAWTDDKQEMHPTTTELRGRSH